MGIFSWESFKTSFSIPTRGNFFSLFSQCWQDCARIWRKITNNKKQLKRVYCFKITVQMIITSSGWQIVGLIIYGDNKILLITTATLCGTAKSLLITRKSSCVNARGIPHSKYSLCCPVSQGKGCPPPSETGYSVPVGGGTLVPGRGYPLGTTCEWQDWGTPPWAGALTGLGYPLGRTRARIGTPQKEYGTRGWEGTWNQKCSYFVRGW